MDVIQEYDEEAYAVPVGENKPNARVHGVRLHSRKRVRLGDILDYLNGKRNDLCIREALRVLMCLYQNKRRWRSKYKALRYAIEDEARRAEELGDTLSYDLLDGVLKAATDERSVVCRKCDACRQMLEVLAKIKPLCELYDKLISIEKTNPQLKHGLSAVWNEMSELKESVVLLRQCDGWKEEDGEPRPDPERSVSSSSEDESEPQY